MPRNLSNDYTQPSPPLSVKSLTLMSYTLAKAALATKITETKLRCGGRNGKGRMGKGGAESAPGVLRVGFWWILQDFEEEGVTVEGNGWHHWKEGQKLGGGAHQGRSGWSKTTGVMDL
ncbi:hypothetical protein BY996DRAFT_6457875 [Phakopsora pachyrhizi]|nr:hypothetical protein BY996DRAFT_6457875 [Phakopsora pachyrhizi]